VKIKIQYYFSSMNAIRMKISST